MAQGQGHLDELAVWDDSALVDSWNEALKEYKKYHGIQAKGGSIRDLKEEDTEATDSRRRCQANGEPGASGVQAEEAAGHQAGKNASSTATDDLPPVMDNAAAPTPAAFPPEVILGSVPDENLKRLLIAWYYAGYYTGLTEGSRQAK